MNFFCRLINLRNFLLLFLILILCFLLIKFSCCNDWNKHLRNFNVGNNVVADLYKATPQKSIELKKEESVTIGKIIRKQWLISLALKMFESSFTIEDEHYNVSGDILKILKGSTVLNSQLDDLIDVFEEKNYKKYCDIKNIKAILEEKKKKKEEEEKAKLKEKKVETPKNENSNDDFSLNKFFWSH